MQRIPCRLCGGDTEPQFPLLLLGRLDVRIHRCGGCESLQTDRPYWLDVAYAPELMGVGMDVAVRSRELEAWITYIALVFGRKPWKTRVLDHGCGPGLLVRTLRDLGFDAAGYDPYVAPAFAPLTPGDPRMTHDMLLSIETWEHFAEPAAELEEIFRPRHDLIIVRTQAYRGEGPGWYYFFPDAGQHVFFYSHRAREWIARKYGYEVRSYGDLSIFSRRPMTWLQRRLLDRHQRPLQVLLSALPHAPRAGINVDNQIGLAFVRRAMQEPAWIARLEAAEARGREAPPTDGPSSTPRPDRADGPAPRGSRGSG